LRVGRWVNGGGVEVSFHENFAAIFVWKLIFESRVMQRTRFLL
jgi:hypothetical protein